MKRPIVDGPEGAFARSVLRLRAGQHLTLKALSERSGVAYSVISLVERGQRACLLRTALALAEALGSSVGEMIASGAVEDQEAS